MHSFDFVGLRIVHNGWLVALKSIDFPMHKNHLQLVRFRIENTARERDTERIEDFFSVSKTE